MLHLCKYSCNLWQCKNSAFCLFPSRCEFIFIGVVSPVANIYLWGDSCDCIRLAGLAATTMEVDEKWVACVVTAMTYGHPQSPESVSVLDNTEQVFPVALQYIPRNMHTVLTLLCFDVVIHWLIFPYPSGLLHWHCGNLTIAPVPAKQPWWIWINTSCEFIINDCITTTKQSTTKPCAYFLGYTVHAQAWVPLSGTMRWS